MVALYMIYIRNLPRSSGFSGLGSQPQAGGTHWDIQMVLMPVKTLPAGGFIQVLTRR